MNAASHIYQNLKCIFCLKTLKINVYLGGIKSIVVVLPIQQERMCVSKVWRKVYIYVYANTYMCIYIYVLCVLTLNTDRICGFVKIACHSNELGSFGGFIS